MKKLSQAKRYQRKIKWDKYSNELCLAASLAIWLIVEKDELLAKAIKTAANVHQVKKAPIGRLIKECIPASFFKKRRAKNMPEGLKYSITNKKIQEHQDKQNMARLE